MSNVREFESSHDRLLRHCLAVRDWWDSIYLVKHNLRQLDPWGAAEAYSELPAPIVDALNLAPSKGGIWSTVERHYLNRDSGFLELVHKMRSESGWYKKRENQH